MRVSVVVPTFNEAALLPGLLEALGAQTTPPYEIIVADAGSVDDTRAIASAAGCSVVDGGLPGAGRNAGAMVATGDILLFLDADVRPEPDFLERALWEFERSDCVVATCLITPLEPGKLNAFLAEVANVYLQIMQSISPRAPGSCVLCLRAIHEAIGGFDESLKLAEDHDYVKRAAALGGFSVLTGVAIPTSMRRVKTEGLVALSLKYLWSEIHAILGLPIRKLPFEYEFGVHAPPGAVEQNSRLAEEIARMREQLTDLSDLLERLGAQAQEFFDDVSERSDAAAMKVRIRELLSASDIALLERYLRQRIRVIKMGRRKRED